MIGKTISHYKILEKLGEGGMGVVYKAEDTKLKREVALKFLPTNALQGKEEKERFTREAQAAAALNHPNIATIYAIEEVDDDTFIVMEYIKGKELRELTTEDRELSIEDVTNYAIQIAEGLKAAHKKGVIHRDIKSSNIMITDEDHVKIMDFGLAKVRGGAQVTKVGTTLGTAAYMSPEQAQGMKTDHRTDIWAFGVVLYEMLSGQMPFPGDYEQAVIYSILNEEPEPNNNLDSLVPKKLKQIVMRCLDKSKDKRYHSCQEILSDLSSKNHNQAAIHPKVSKIKFAKSNLILEEDIFIGREAQLEFLLEKFKNIRETKESTVFIYGESGIGKSQLVAKALGAISKSGINIIWGRSLFLEGGLPYHPFVSGIK